MNEIYDNLRVGIFIPTMNRADFIIRQLNYYASVNCPHSIYIGDSSRPEEREKIIKAIQKIGNKLKIRLENHDGLSVTQSSIKLLDTIEEKYVCFIGDDDIQIPASLTKCAQFLEDNPDYATVSGHAVAVRVRNNGVYGDIDRISDYPTGELLIDSPSERIVEYLKNYYVIMFYVSRTEQIRKSWQNMEGIKDKALAAEIIPTSSLVIAGKSKKLDCLCFIRQIHDAHYILPNTLDWLMGEHWRSSFFESLNKLSNELVAKESIPKEKALNFLKEGFWLYIQKQLIREHYEAFPYKIKNVEKSKLKTLRSSIGDSLPFLKYVYRRWIKPMRTGKRYVHFEVTQPYSKYFKDFKPVIDSITGQIEI